MRGSYQETALAAVLGRAAFVALFLALLYSAFFGSFHLFASTHVAHFAGFYVFSLACAATSKRRALLSLGGYLVALAILVELIRTVSRLPLASSYLDLMGDLAGIVAGLAPMLLQKIRTELTREADPESLDLR